MGGRLTSEQRVNLFAGIFTAAVIAAVAAFLVLRPSPLSPDEVADALDLETPARPEPPDLAADLGGGPAGTVCISFDLADNFETAMKPLGRSGEEEEIGSLVERTLKLAGLDTGTEGCGVRLVVRVSGRRLSAAYQGLGSCFTGYDLDGTATLSTGAVSRDFALDDRKDPPQAISGCTSRDPDRPFTVNSWREELLVSPLHEAFGNRFAAAAALVGLDTADWIALTSPDEPVIDLLLIGLSQGGGRRSAANAALEELAVRYPDDPDLQAAIPYLIRVFARLYDEPTPTVHRASDPYGDTLQGLTGAGTDAWTPAEWYDWWLDQEG